LSNTIPTELVAVPRAPYREMRALNAGQLERLFASSRDSRWNPLWVVLGTVGLRIGEALGLKWSDVDLASGRLQVRRALQRQRGRGLVFVEPKSVTSRRCIYVSNLALTALRLQRQRSAGGRSRAR
jgi:integrase